MEASTTPVPGRSRRRFSLPLPPSHSHTRETSTTLVPGRSGRRFSTIQREETNLSNLRVEHRRIEDDSDINLPFQTLADDADLTEYTQEFRGGKLLRRTITVATGEVVDWKLVAFEINDPENPKNWSKLYKWYCTMIIALVCFVVAFASSVITADIEGPARDLGMSEEVSLLAITLFVAGFGIGPMAFAPLSEIVGRKIIYVTTLGIAVIFIIPCAVAKNPATLLVCRAIDGIAFSAPMTLVGGSLADLWKTEERGVPMAAFSAAPFLGPALGPLVGGFVADDLGWRWLYWITLIIAGSIYLLMVLTVPETYTPTLLSRRAAKLRRETGDMQYVTEEDLDVRPLWERLQIFLVRPFQLLFGELIVFLISLYMSVLYGLLYMFFVAYPIIFQEGKGFSASKTGLMFIPLAIGVIGSAVCAPFVNKHYLTLRKKHGGRPPPEVRLVPMMLSCWFIPIGLFIFAWSSYHSLSWAGPAIGGGFPVGFGFIFLYNAANNYLVDSYQHQAASALAAKTCIRSFWGAATVLFTTQMYHRLGDQWASTLLAFIALACCIIPFLFYFLGARIRRRSKYAYVEPEEQDEEKKIGSH